MSDVNNKSSHRVVGKVRWRRFAIVAGPAVAIAGTLVGLTAEGAIASSISVSGQAYTITASQLSGSGFEQFGNVLTDTSGHPHPVMESVIGTANLTNLCQSVSIPVPGLGTFTLRLTAGGGSSGPAVADNLIVDADAQTGSQAVFHNITIGQDASTLTDAGVAGPAGGFGQQASDVTITNLRQNTWLTRAGTFTLPDLSISFGGAC